MSRSTGYPHAIDDAQGLNGQRYPGPCAQATCDALPELSGAPVSAPSGACGNGHRTRLADLKPFQLLRARSPTREFSFDTGVKRAGGMLTVTP